MVQLTLVAQKGKSAHLLKASSKRKRTHAEISEDRLLEKELKEDPKTFIASKKKMEADSKKKDLQIQEMGQYKEMLKVLYDQGVVDEHGWPVGKK